MEDVIGATRFTIARPEVTGPLNVVSPQPLRCRDFARTLGRVLRRPAVLPMPAPMARLAIGEMADALLLASAKVRPAALERLGFSFRVPSLDQAIRQALEDLERGLGAAGE
jgi:NAD dependent epimerase/dehydratase family enzyme